MLKPLVFETLLALSDQPQHGWSLVRVVQAQLPRERILPGNFYRTLRGMVADGLIEESPRSDSRSGEDERRRYFRMTPLGRETAAAEARRLESLVLESRAKRLLSSKGRP